MWRPAAARDFRGGGFPGDQYIDGKRPDGASRGVQVGEAGRADEVCGGYRTAVGEAWKLPVEPQVDPGREPGPCSERERDDPEATTGAKHSAALAEEDTELGGVEELQGEAHEDGVETIVGKRQPGRVADVQFDAFAHAGVANALRRDVAHARRDVDADDPSTLPDCSCELDECESGSVADLEHGLTHGHREETDTRVAARVFEPAFERFVVSAAPVIVRGAPRLSCASPERS